MSISSIRIEREGARALAIVDRPEVLNALNIATLTELRQVVEELERDEGVRAVVITGAVGAGKSPAFVAGAGIGGKAAMGAGAGGRVIRVGQEVMGRSEAMPKPVVAAGNGA